jgi:type IV fimbrial biogenesis protein FimT
MRTPVPQQGFTLIELMVTITVLAILASLAGPSMGDMIERRRLASQTEAITDLLHLARSEAIKHSGVALPRSVAVTVSPGSSWFVGVANGDTACTSATTCVLNDGGQAVARYVSNTECAGCTMTAPTGTDPELMVFSFRGLVEAGGADRVVELSSPRGYKTRVSVSRIGRVSVCSPSGPLSSYPAC